MNELLDPALYQNQIEKLHEKLNKRKNENKIHYNGVPFAQIYYERSKVAKLIANAIADRQYVFSPPTIKTVNVQNKKRIIYEFSSLDKVVQSVLYSWMSDKTKIYLSDHVYSFTKGHSSREAVINFGKYLKKNCHPQTGHQNIFVLHSDITTYGESIPIIANSKLWEQLKKITISHENKAFTKYIWSLIENSLRPILQNELQHSYQQIIGLPTGTPLSNLCINIYLKPVDDFLDAIPGGYYARYGDDFIFSHPDYDTFQFAVKNAHQLLDNLGMQINKDKEQCLYLTRAGKKHSDYTDVKGAQNVSILGYLIAANGNISIGSRGIHAFLKTLRKRIRMTAALLKELPPEEKGRLLCKAINQFMDNKNILKVRQTKRILHETRDRKQLKYLDLQIACMVAEICSGMTGIKALRYITYRKMRSDWHLKSLCYQKYHVVKSTLKETL